MNFKAARRRRKELPVRKTVALWRCGALMVVLQIPLIAQNQLAYPVPPLKGPGFAVGIGYEHFAMQVFSSHIVPLNGLEANGVMEFNRRWALTTDLSYLRASNVLGTGQEGYILNLQAGPELCLKENRKGWFFVHALGGSALVDSAVPTESGYLQGWVARPSFAAGGGMERTLQGPFGIRVYGDFIRTAFANSLATVETKSNFRCVVSLVFRLPFRGGAP